MIPAAIGFVVFGLSALLAMGFGQAMSDNADHRTSVRDYAFAFFFALYGAMMLFACWHLILFARTAFWGP